MGIGDTWGTREELLHPRDKNGRFRSKWKMAAGVVDAITNILAKYNPRTFGSDQQAAQYLFNRKPRGKGGVDLARMVDLHATNEALRRGDMDPSTKKFVQMMDSNKVTLPDDVIVSRRITPESLGLTHESMGQDEGGVEDFTGKLIADRGYSPVNIGTPLGQNTGILMAIAVPKGTQAIIPGDGPGSRELILDRDQEYRITKVTPDGSGGYYMMAVATERTPGDTPDPVGRPAPGTSPSVQQREQAVSQVTTGQQRNMRIESDPQVAQSNATRQAAQPAGQQQVASPPGTPPPRTEPVVSRSVGGTPDAAPGGASPAAAPGAAPAPEVPAPAPRRVVDIRTALQDAAIPSPSRGRNRAAFNEAYLGVISGKKDPVDAVRELDADIAALRRGGEGRDRGGTLQPQTLDENREGDISALEQLRDLLREQYDIPAPKPTKAAPRKAPAAKKATPRKVAPETPVTPSKVVPPPPAAKAAPVKRVTAAEARRQAVVQALKQDDVKITGREGAGYNNVMRNLESGDITPARARMELKASEKFWRKAADDSQNYGRATPAERAAIRDKNNTIADRYAKAIAAITDAEGVKAPAAKKAAPAKKAASAAGGDDLDSMTKVELVAEARKRQLSGYSSKSKDQLKAMIRESGVSETGTRKVDVPDVEDVQQMRVIPKTQVQGGDLAVWQVPGEVPVVGRVVDEGPRKKFVDWDGGRREALGSAKGSAKITFHREAAPGDKVFIERNKDQRVSAPKTLPAKAVKAAVPQKVGVKSINAFSKGDAHPGISDADYAKISDYVGGGFSGLNKELRNGDNPGSEALDRVMADSRTTESITVYRGLRTGNGVFGPKDKRPADLTGFKWTDSGYVSTSLDKNTAAGFATSRIGQDPGVVLEITVPAGVGALDLRGGPLDEHELLLQRKLDFNTLGPGEPITLRGQSVPVLRVEATLKPSADREQQARDRQATIDRARGFGEAGAELDQLINDQASDRALQARLDAVEARRSVGADLNPVREALQAGDRVRAQREMDRLLEREGITKLGSAGEVTRFNPSQHEAAGGRIREGATVEVIRPGHTMIQDGKPVRLSKAIVDETDEPRSTIPGPRVDAPVDNAPRKKVFKDAWAGAGIELPDGSAKRSLKEITDDISAGRITPQEGIRRLENDISFHKQELADIEADLRGDMAPADRRRLVAQAEKLETGLSQQERASAWLRGFFGDEPVTAQEVITLEVDPDIKRALDEATPEMLREAAVKAGLPVPDGNTKDEVFQDIVRKMAQQ